MEEATEKKTEKPRKSRKRLLWKIPAIIACSLLGLVLLVMILCPIILTSERLTRWVEEYGSDYLVDGQVKVERVDLSIWSTFPHVELQVTGLEVLNLNDEIPDEYKQVISVEDFSGRLNLLSLLRGRIDIGRVKISDPRFTMWMLSDEVNSLTIFPSDEEEEEEETELPDIHISSFEIVGEATVRYILPDEGVETCISLTRTSLSGRDEAPQYALDVAGDVSGLGAMADALPVGVNGEISWSPERPLAIELSNFNISFDDIHTRFSANLDLAEPLHVNALDLQVEPVKLSRLAALLGDLSGFPELLPRLDGDATFGFGITLNKPFVMGEVLEEMPDMQVRFLVDGSLELPDYYLTLNNLGLDLAVNVRENIEEMDIELNRLNLRFPSTDITLSGRMSNLLDDPLLTGCLRGQIDFSQVNPRFWAAMGMRMRGRLDADVDFNMNLSDLTPNGFHRARITGDATLEDFEALMPADSLLAGATCARFDFGTANKFVTADFRADSLLTASLSIDSAWVMMPEMTARLSELKVGAGMENRAASADPATVTPMGGRLTLKSLRYLSHADSSRMVMRNLDGSLRLHRYDDSERTPSIEANIGVGRLAYASGADRMSLRGARINAGAHPSAQSKARRKPLSEADSARIAERRKAMILSESSVETIDFGIDRSAVSLLKRWNIAGGVSARSGRMVSPEFPLRIAMTGLDMGFAADSVVLRSLTVNAGESDFSLSGRIRNIQRALGRRNHVAPLSVELELRSDSLNVNELIDALMRGAAYSASAAGGAMPDDDDDDIESAVIADIELPDDAETMAPLVPVNIDARLKLSAGTVLYSTLEVRNFGGEILIADGAANLRDLHAETEVGSVDLNMLYSAPTRSDIDFGLALDFNRFNLGKVTEVIPVLDSIMPILNTMAGTVDANITATMPADSLLNVDMARLKAMVRLAGDSLTLIDPQTFKTVSKWLFFHDKNKNMIDHMEVQLAMEDNMLQIYPFVFDFDRYRLGVMGHNDLDMNLNYHVSVLKSPIPFKFGINVKGTADKMKIRLGRARFKEEMAARSIAVSDTVRMNLAREIRSVYARGARNARLAPLSFRRPEELPPVSEEADTISASEMQILMPSDTVASPQSTGIKQ